jgi:hypothetical protein
LLGQPSSKSNLAAPVAEPLQPRVRVLRVPDGGIEPDAAVDGGGDVHLVYFKGDPAHGDIFYARTKRSVDFGTPVRVNSKSACALVVGSVRGPRLAIGKNNRVHVVWTGSEKAEPRAPGGATPLLFARLNDGGDGFERERNVISRYPGLDGGGGVAADKEGNVYVAWHAPRTENREADRFVWVARSTDDGRTFEPEAVANKDTTGACGCCALRICTDADGHVFLLYRSATELVHRDMYLLESEDRAHTFKMTKVSTWEAGACVMSTAAFAQGDQKEFAAWESKGQVYLGTINPSSGRVLSTLSMPGEARGRKHPAVAANANGDVIVAWTEGTAWERGGNVAWQVFDREGKVVEGARGSAEGLPVWGTPTVFTRPDGTFIVMF